MSGAALDPHSAACAVALTTLAGMGPARLRALLDGRDPADAWAQVLAGRGADDPAVAAACRPGPAGLAREWARAAAATDVEAVAARHRAAGVEVLVLGAVGYPDALAGDHEAPAVLFARGRLGALGGPRVAVVGTRRCTPSGRELAHQLGADLAGAGVAVVSGLALGIDGAAHEGAVAARAAPPVAVVGSGLDVVYPRRHARLWEAVAEGGLLLSEAPLGAPPEAWRFPVRNRVIAALADVVVVVESHRAGGSLHTVAAAAERAVAVLAVPGSVGSPASAGTNQLLFDGCAVARDAADVLAALGLETAGVGRRAAAVRRPPPGPDEVPVLAAVGPEPTGLEEVLRRTGLGPGEAARALGRLESAGWLRAGAGWWERAPG